jgi:hypothetical protein
LQIVGCVKEWHSVGPGNIFRWVRNMGRFEFNTGEVFNDSIGCCTVSMPEWPPTLMVFREGLVSFWRG